MITGRKGNHLTKKRMKTKEEVQRIVKKYLDDNKIEYLRISDKAHLENQEVIPYGKYEDQIKNVYTIAYYQEGHQDDVMMTIVIDADSGELLFGFSPGNFLDI